MSLVEQFFERDLSEAEADQLEALLQSSPEAAEQMAALAERDYRATGLPTPLRGGSARSKKALFWILGAGLAAGGAGFWLTQSERPGIQVAQEEDSSFSESQLAPEAPALRPRQDRPAAEAAPALSGPEEAKHGKRFGMQVDGAHAGQVKVQVFDASGRCVRHVYEGALAEGQHRLAWDGKLDGGQKAGPGRYTLEVHSSAGVSRLAIKL